MYIFGGNSDKSLDDMYCFNINESTWEIVKPSSIVPKHREGHSSCLFDDKNIFIYGGWNGKDIHKDYFFFNVET